MTIDITRHPWVTLKSIENGSRPADFWLCSSGKRGRSSSQSLRKEQGTPRSPRTWPEPFYLAQVNVHPEVKLARCDRSCKMMQSSNNIEMTDQASVADTVNSDISGVPLDSVEAGSSLPHPQEVRTSMSSARGKTGVRIYVYIAIGTIVLLSLIIGLAVGIPKSNKSASSTSLSFVPRKATRAQLVEYFVVHGVSPRFALEQSTSPQGMAVEWLAGRDGQNLAVPEGDLSSSEGYALLERYVLAILYYSTNGPQWRSRTGFLSDNDVCTWAGLRYNGRNFFDFGVVCLGQTSERTMRALYLGTFLKWSRKPLVSVT